jgi:hypothetical protein
MYRKYATLKGAAEETAEHLRPIWERLQGEISAPLSLLGLTELYARHLM